MIWVKVDVDLFDHPRLLACPDANAALGLWLRGLAYSRKHMLDGFIPALALRGFVDPAGDLASVTALAEQLIQVGLWTRDKDGFRVHRYAEKGNQTRKQILAAAKKSRDKTKSWRMRKVSGGNQVTTPVTHPVTNPVTHRSPLTGYSRLSGSSYSSSYSYSDLPEGEGEPERGGESGAPHSPEPEPAAPPPQKYQAAYERGIEAGIKRPFALVEKHRGALHQALLKHAKDAAGKTLKGDGLLRWIESQARQFAAQIPPEEHKFYSGLQPTGWLRWLNETPIEDAGAHLPPTGASRGNVVAANGHSETHLRAVPPGDLFALAAGIGKGGG